MNLANAALLDIVGKTIKAVVTREDRDSSPHCQVFLVFTDNTYYGLYGDDIHATSGAESGDEEAALRYAQQFGGKIASFVSSP